MVNLIEQVFCTNLTLIENYETSSSTEKVPCYDGFLHGTTEQHRRDYVVGRNSEGRETEREKANRRTNRPSVRRRRIENSPAY